ncbi:hypothetical protein CLAFUW4_11266 [Fulvia fulva]|uniref:Large ribosomal subunit protein mL50 n=1 Tax=Passalora fulva TaxID=5499 RepID=A0A9Q8PCL5_PASFU|nr:uncharacterized protein CLAFUR5_10309 [Fulvia fulva]KAK4620000.1 hypothetical protein CLAFUR4_11272 [Fulvia fulva]KAK4621113.1 hypothetical protein CLAFUR0_11277 [Fulvia fulva]UJO19957.1 hypothetical protein CLAFUR5_10309 [Fulvia fulva]WPV17537.1 hypothetical protein CLAFUW4_11266 [Fulvia fulva]WPV31931.1 hypothetical protein CLAFUW7_11262 [Fulvia fulva]
MRHLRPAQQALRLAAESLQQPYVCRACLAQARSIHTTSPRFAGVQDDEPFWKRMRKNLFGSKEATHADKSREEKRKRRLEEQPRTGPVTKTDTKGRVWEVAEVVDPTTHSNYVVSNTWQGLESVGSEEWVRRRADGGEQYQGFMAQKKLQLTNAQWQKLLRQIAVEVFSLQKQGRNVLEVCNEEPTASQEALMGKIRLVDFTEVELPGEESQSMRKVDVQDPMIKLAIIKRAMQLTGKRIPDPDVSSATSLEDLYNAFKIKEKIKKLAQTPQLQQVSQQAPNVQVHASRRTPVHKEKEIGRWKMIEDELVLRDLPVFGSRYQDSKEVWKNGGL